MQDKSDKNPNISTESAPSVLNIINKKNDDELTEQHVFEPYPPGSIYLKIQIKMADEEIIEKDLELYQICKSRGERANLFIETMNGKDLTVNFTIKCPAGPPPAGTSSSARRRWTTPSQIKRDKEWKEKFLYILEINHFLYIK